MSTRRESGAAGHPSTSRSRFVSVGVLGLVAALVFALLGPRGESGGPGFSDHLLHLLAAGPLVAAAEAAPATLDRTGWTASADSEESDGPASNVLDGSATSLWHTRWRAAQDPLPHWIALDLKATTTVGGLVMQPRPVSNRNGNPGRYEIHVSTSSSSWGTAVATGTFADTADAKTVVFAPTDGRYVRLRVLSEAGNRGPWTSMAELNLLAPQTDATPSPTPTRTSASPSPTATTSAPAPTPITTPTGTSKGAWSSSISLPLVPGAAAQLPNGNILTWSAYLPYDWNGNWYGIGRTQTATLNPATGAVSSRTVSETGHDMFCPGTSMLSDGRIVVTGGTTAGRTSIYNPSTSSWSRGPDMKVTRGYQGQTTLADNRVFVLGGSWSGGVGGKSGEVWSQAAGWQRLTGVPVAPILTADPAGQYRSDNHGWFFTWTGNRVFHAGPSRQMNWFSTAGNGGYAPAGNRGDDDHAMNGDAVMYEQGKLLTVGGAPAYDDSVATNRAYVVDIRNGVTTKRVANMAHARAFHNAVVLPDGKVAVVGGQGFAKGFSDATSVYTAELWDPATEKFTSLAPASIARNYHSVALLLPDGRVLSAGGGMCGNCATNHPDAQILTPPYLLNADGSPKDRPRITSYPGEVAAGGTITMSTDRRATSFSLVRLGADTHTVNNDQRRLVLTRTGGNTGGTKHNLSVPSDRGIALPGYYMLFAMDAQGVPTLSRTIRVK